MFSPDEELSMDQVATDECETMAPALAHHVHRVAAHALSRRCSQLTQLLYDTERARDSAREQLARFQQTVREHAGQALDEFTQADR